jgi:hypothetical protein
MEKYIWSLDISTTNVGSSLWNSKGKLIELKHLALKSDKDTLVEDRDIFKADVLKNYCIAYKERIINELNGEIIYIFVEAPLQNTPKNINTTALLLGFNGMARYVLHEVFDIMPIKISVHDSRKLFCPELVHFTKKKNRKTNQIEIIETLSFPEEYKEDKKLYIWEKVSKLEPQIEWFYTRNNTLKDMCFDMSDSYCCGYSGMIKLGIVKKNG